jgi:hypothetical protein
MLGHWKALFRYACIMFQKCEVLSLMQNCFHLDLPVNCGYQWYVQYIVTGIGSIYVMPTITLHSNEKNSADSMD